MPLSAIVFLEGLNSAAFGFVIFQMMLEKNVLPAVEGLHLLESVICIFQPAYFLCFSGCSEVGQEEKQAQDELREVESWPALLLRQEHHPQDVGEALRLPLCL